MLTVLRVAHPVIGDARAAGERDPAVDDERLAMRAVIETAEGIRPHGVVPRKLTLSLVENLQNFVAD